MNGRSRREYLEVIYSRYRPPPTAGSEGDANNPSVDFRGERRSNDTHESTTDAEARLYKKAGGRKPSWLSSVTC